MRSIAEMPEVVDLAVICLPGQFVLDAAEAALARGVKALCVISSGFAEIGADGRERQERPARDSFAPTAAGSSARTASASPSRTSA